ncbi:uncharacterized protein [Palaemon carinicauda]|uniref:uncharacterized protein n=1 Tax=Palaemon carinicauda TaxID=392227 RepID=UPI0035B61180
MTIDKGPAFISDLWVSLARLMGTNLPRMNAYNQAANGMVERSHCSLKAALMARCTDKHWVHQLPWVLLGLKQSPKVRRKHLPGQEDVRRNTWFRANFSPPSPATMTSASPVYMKKRETSCPAAKRTRREPSTTDKLS